MGRLKRSCALFLSLTLTAGNVSYAAEESVIWQGGEAVEEM